MAEICPAWVQVCFGVYLQMLRSSKGLLGLEGFRALGFTRLLHKGFRRLGPKIQRSARKGTRVAFSGFASVFRKSARQAQGHSPTVSERTYLAQCCEVP